MLTWAIHSATVSLMTHIRIKSRIWLPLPLALYVWSVRPKKGCVDFSPMDHS